MTSTRWAGAITNFSAGGGGARGRQASQGPRSANTVGPSGTDFVDARNCRAGRPPIVNQVFPEGKFKKGGAHVQIAVRRISFGVRRYSAAFFLSRFLLECGAIPPLFFLSRFSLLE